MVQTFGDQLLARPPLANDEHRAVERRGAARPLDRVEKGKALADELVCPLHAPTVGGESHHLASIFTPISLENQMISEMSGISENMARDLYCQSRFRALMLEFGVLE